MKAYHLEHNEVVFDRLDHAVRDLAEWADRLQEDKLELLEACHATLVLLNDMTTDDFSKGEDKLIRDTLEKAIRHCTLPRLGS